MDKEINIGRLIRKIEQIHKFNQFYKAGENIEKIEIVNVTDEYVQNFKHLLTDIENEVKRIKEEIRSNLLQ